jgi:hypothetical protein
MSQLTDGGYTPALVRFTTFVGIQRTLSVKPSGAFNAVVFAKTWQVLGGLRILELRKMS